MSAIFTRCDLAISASGSTLYELCACGTPSISFLTAENQLQLSAGMQKMGVTESVGWIGDEALERMQVAIRTMKVDFKRRLQMTALGQELVDGLGAERIVGALLYG
jgi:spore coat polysaccharide biosynthesis predicted glycosyltransferase SpsG